jgi:hypothetical protein
MYLPEFYVGNDEFSIGKFFIFFDKGLHHLVCEYIRKALNNELAATIIKSNNFVQVIASEKISQHLARLTSTGALYHDPFRDCWVADLRVDKSTKAEIQICPCCGGGRVEGNLLETQPHQERTFEQHKIVKKQMEPVLHV